jgi:hypothetical protein
MTRWLNTEKLLTLGIPNTEVHRLHIDRLLRHEVLINSPISPIPASRQKQQTKLTMPDEKSYTASCHCGNVKLSFFTSPPIEETDVVSCNCRVPSITSWSPQLTTLGSICHINGYMLTYIPTSKVTFEMDKDAVTVSSLSVLGAWNAD